MLTFAQGKQLTTEMFILGSYEDFPVSKIIEVLVAADEAYFNDEDTFIEDTQYDALKQYAARLAPTDMYFTGVGSDVRGGKIDLPHKLGSLNQVYQGDYAKWVAKHNIYNDQVVVTDKLDGASALLVYGTNGALQIAYSRGNGIQGADITRHVRKIHNVPQTIKNPFTSPVLVRVENIISPEMFSDINTGEFSRKGRIYKNPRNMVSGLMNASENHHRIYQAIDTIAYEIIGVHMNKDAQLSMLKEWGFTVVDFFWMSAGKLDDNTLTNFLKVSRDSSKYELDGLVIDINDTKIRQNLASDDLNPEYAVKFKVADTTNFSLATVKGVEWNLSKDGYYKPRVQIVPVDLCGVTIQNLTGFNAKFIKEQGIGPGAIIQITRSGDVIPFILGVTTPTTPHLPDDDTAVWTDTGVDLVVKDVSNNATVKFERLNDFFASIDAPYLGDGNLMKMFEMGFDTPEKIIELTVQDVSSLVGSSAIGRKIHAGLKAKLTDIPLYVLMGSHHAFGRGVGVRKMKKLYEAFNGDMSRCVDASSIIGVDGFEEKTAVKIQRGYDEFSTFLLAIEPYVTVAKYQPKKQGSLTGKDIVITGFRDKDLDARIELEGGRVGSGVSSKTFIVVAANPNESSTKLKKARDLNIPIMSKDQFIATLTA